MGRTIHWTEDTKTMKIRTDNPNYFLEFGHQLVDLVYNNTGQQLSAGTVVYINGSYNNFPTITKSDYSTDETSEGSMGVVAHTINNNDYGYIITKGLLRNVPTSQFNLSDKLYLFTGGTMTSIRPNAPLPEVLIGVVTKIDATSGMINVDIDKGFELNEIHDVNITTQPNDGQVLTFDTTNKTWTPKDVRITINTGNTTSISFSSSTFYFTSSTPGNGNITSDLTNAKMGIVQKIYHNSNSTPTFPNGWVKMGVGSYTTNSLNVIYCEWVGGSRVEYWITQ